MTDNTIATLAAAFAAPAVYANHVHLASNNGLFRMTFYESANTADGSVQVPRCAIVLTKESAQVLLQTLGFFLMQVDAAQGTPQ